MMFLSWGSAGAQVMRVTRYAMRTVGARGRAFTLSLCGMRAGTAMGGFQTC